MRINNVYINEHDAYEAIKFIMAYFLGSKWFLKIEFIEIFNTHEGYWDLVKNLPRLEPISYTTGEGLYYSRYLICA